MNPRKSPSANLENKKAIFFEIGLIVVLAMIYFSLNAKSYKTYKPVLADLHVHNMTEEMAPITTQQEKKPILAPKQFMQIRIVDNNVNADDKVIIDAGVYDDTRVPDYAPTSEENVAEKRIFIAVQKKPTFPGGEATLMNYLSSHINYPELARETGVQGKVYLKFVVEPNGKISNVEVIRGIGAGCDEEAIRVVKNMPRWNPGMQMGKPVRVAFSLAVNFRLQ
ncbi:MAG: energy transducer TonB [Bacteroidales bacterium]|nr:energy transducer TonB [Bacteroidales bacterium]